MQPTPGGGTGGSGSELSRGGLARFRSAPATWLEALLEEEGGGGGGEEEEDDPLKPNQSLTQLLTSNSTTPTSRDSVTFSSSADSGLFGVGPSSGFFRQNSSPAEFLGNSGIGSEGYLSDFGIPAANFNYVSSNIDTSPGSWSKRAREMEAAHLTTKFSPQLKVEQSDQLPGGVAGLMDVEMEKLLEDSVPSRVRAKRGCATHPRSIAERVRRTRISDRIRKLQELVPNMDKQTNTADMLDEAVEYVKQLQKKIQELSENQRRCKCMIKD